MTHPPIPPVPDDDAAARLSALLGTLYGGLTRDPPWEAFLSALADACGATFATLLVATKAAGVDAHVTPGADPARAEEYDRLAAADPFVGLPEGEVVAFSDFVSHVPDRFRAWLDKAGSGQILGIDLNAPSGASVRLRVTRDHSRRDFTEADHRFLAGLVPHLRIALDLYGRLTSTHAERQLFSTTMEGLAVATVILARDRRILRRNALAERLLGEDGPVGERQGRLAPGPGGSALERLLRSPPPPGKEVRVQLSRADGPPLAAIARVLPANIYGDGAFLALFIADPNRTATLDAATLRDRFQLTPTEAALAMLLLDGAALVEAARTLDMAHNTARSHLRSIFAKTGAHRQAQLIQLLRSTADAFGV